MKFWKDISLGRYIYRESLIHNLAPGVKLISLFLLGLGLILLKGSLILPFFALLLFYGVAISRIPFKAWYKGFRIFIWFFLIFILFYTLSRYRTAPLDVNRVIRLKNGLSSGALAALRWAILIGFCFLFTMTTTPTEIAQALEDLLTPLRKIRFPIHDLSIMAGLTLHFLPILKDETDRLIKVRKVQGIDSNADSFSQTIQNITGLVSPLIHRIYRRSEALALAMEARGYTDDKASYQRNVYLSERMSRKDIWVLVSVFIFLITLWSISRFIL